MPVWRNQIEASYSYAKRIIYGCKQVIIGTDFSHLEGPSP